MLDQLRNQLYQKFLERRALEGQIAEAELAKEQLAKTKRTEDALIAQIALLEQQERAKAAETGARPQPAAIPAAPAATEGAAPPGDESTAAS